MIFTKEKIQNGFFVGVVLLIVILLFTIVDHFLHGLQSIWGVPDYYFKDKIPAGFFWAVIGLFLAKKFQNIWLKSLIVAGLIALALQVRYFITGYALSFVLLFLLFHFVILFFLLAGLFWLLARCKGLADGNQNMKKIIIAVIILAVVAVGTYFLVFKNKTSQAPALATNGTTVSIKNFAFNPSSLIVKTGTKVTWINNDGTSHTVTSDSGNLLDSAVIAPGGTFEFTFGDPGTVNYHCRIHSSMKGQIIVQ